jgi:hypothetical protein
VDRVRLARGRTGREGITLRSLSQIPADATVSGHVYDARTGTLREVDPAG